MSLFDILEEGTSQHGLRVVLAGVEKIGKTTLAASAPNAILIPAEVGYGNVKIRRVPMLQCWENLIDYVNDVTIKCQECASQGIPLPVSTLIFDSATAIERLLHDYTLRTDPNFGKKKLTMESAHEGYGRAYSVAKDTFDAFLKTLDDLAVYGGINIIFTCHVFAAKVVDPTAGEYDFWDLLLHSPKNMKTYGVRELLTQWVDVLGFLYSPIAIGSDPKTKVKLATDLGLGRVLGLSRTPNYIAGNRFGIEGEIQIPKEGGWQVILDKIQESRS